MTLAIFTMLLASTVEARAPQREEREVDAVPMPELRVPLEPPREVETALWVARQAVAFQRSHRSFAKIDAIR